MNIITSAAPAPAAAGAPMAKPMLCAAQTRRGSVHSKKMMKSFRTMTGS
jgi:hypothetical protein